MITLYGFGPAFGLPDPSPFVVKTIVQLHMANLPFKTERGLPPSAPKGKIPYIEDEGAKVADSTFIRAHIEKKYGVDLDRGLSPEQRAQAWAIERMLEDHLYWAMVYTRWIDDANFAKGPARFFDAAPPEMRDALRAKGREGMRQYLHGQGLGRHSAAEVTELGGRSLDALAAILDTRPYLMGKDPCGADAIAYGVVAGIIVPSFESALRDRAKGHVNLVSYCERMRRRYFPDFSAA